MTNNSKDNSAFHFFLFLVSFLALAFLATGIGAILFQLINKFLPDALRYGSGLFSQQGVKYGIASILVAGPLYLYLMALINKHLRQGKIPETSTVRKWLTYIILFVAAAVIVIDLVTLIFNLLEGELVARFILKVLVVFAIAAFVFGYYFWAIRKKDLKGKKYSYDKISFIALIVIMTVILVSSFFIVDSPVAARDKKVDNQTINDLSSLNSSIQAYYRQNKELPADIEALRASDAYGPRFSQQSNISYERISKKDFKLCADFRRSSLDDIDDDRYKYLDGWQHQPGRACFEKQATALDSEPIPMPIPMPVRLK